MLQLVRLTDDYTISSFDCGDDDLNDFLLNDSKAFQKKQIAYTYILEDDGKILAYFCLLNDKISRQDSSNSMWKQLLIERYIELFEKYPYVV